MKGHQGGGQLPEAGRSHVLRSIERMKPGPAQRRCVTDIVQPRRCDQTVRCLGIETPTQPLGSRRDAPDMRQPPRLLSQPRLGLAPCTLRQNPAHSRQLTSHSTMTQPPRSL